MKSAAVLLAAAGVAGFAIAETTVDRVVVRQQWPWSTDVLIEYMLAGGTDKVDIDLQAWNGKGSRNHIMFGDVSAWMYRYLGGFDFDEENPGAIALKPGFLEEVGGLGRVSWHSKCMVCRFAKGVFVQGDDRCRDESQAAVARHARTEDPWRRRASLHNQG